MMGVAKEQLGWIFNIARGMSQRLPRMVEVGDLIGDGFIGLSRAVNRFDPSRGVPFKAFAIRLIQFAMRDGLRQRDPLPRAIRHREHPPTFCDIDSVPLAAPPCPDRLEQADEVAGILASLPRRDRVVLQLYYLEDMTMRQIATCLGITEAGVSLRRKKIIQRIQRMKAEG